MGKVWFITGATRGIGQKLVQAALSAGDQVAATGRNLEQLKKVHAGNLGNVLPIRLDVTNEDEAQTAAEAAVAHFGRIDVLVNNAGFGRLGLFEEVGPKAIAEQFNTNLFGLFNVTRAVLPFMRRQRSGQIFNMSSIAGSIGFAAGSIYCASKYAVEGFSESLALELTEFGIKVSIVAPGFFRTEFMSDTPVHYDDKVIEDYRDLSAKLHAIYDVYHHNRPGDPEKLAGAIVTISQREKPPGRFLAGPDAVSMATDKMVQVRSEIANWRRLSEGTNISE